MQQIQGTVIHLDPAYLGKKDRSVWAVIGKLALALALVPILLPLWLLGFMFRGRGSRPGFLSQVGVRVTSFWLSMRLFGHNGDIMVRDFRVPLRANIAEHCCPVKSRTESTGCRDRRILLGSSMLGGPVKWAFFQKAGGCESVEFGKASSG